LETGLHSSSLTNLSPSASARAQCLAKRKEKEIMMFKTAKFVLVCYVLLMFKPSMPLLNDWIAHTFYEKQHLLMVHEVKGKFHIHQELAKAGDQAGQQKTHESKVEVQGYFNVLPTIFKAVLNEFNQGNAYLSYAYHYPITPYRNVHYPPPKCIAQDKVSEAMFIHGNYFGLSTKG
jgi:hypothetical protein